MWVGGGWGGWGRLTADRDFESVLTLEKISYNCDMTAANEASRKRRARIYGVRNGGRVGISSIAYGSSGGGRRYPINALSQLVALLLAAHYLESSGPQRTDPQRREGCWA